MKQNKNNGMRLNCAVYERSQRNRRASQLSSGIRLTIHRQNLQGLYLCKHTHTVSSVPQVATYYRLTTDKPAPTIWANLLCDSKPSNSKNTGICTRYLGPVQNCLDPVIKLLLGSKVSSTATECVT